MNRLRPFFLLVSSLCLGLGISLPLMHFEKLWLFTETPSLLIIIADLWSENEILLALVVALFSIVFPVTKLWTAFLTVFQKRATPKWASALAKWSMLDVLLVALAIFAAKTSGLANAITQPGLWFFALSAITVALATAGIKR